MQSALRRQAVRLVEPPLARFQVREGSIFCRTAPCNMAMKPGTPMPALSFVKGQDPVVALERKEYPPWVNTLAEPMISLARLRRLPFEEATNRNMMRYLKLKRRARIKDRNENSVTK